MDKDKEIEDLKDRLNCEHQVTEAVGANLKYYKDKCKKIRSNYSTLMDCQNGLWNDYWDAIDEITNQNDKVKKLKRDNQLLNDKNEHLKYYNLSLKSTMQKMNLNGSF